MHKRTIRGFGENALVEQIKRCFETDAPLPVALHDAAMQLYRYAIKLSANNFGFADGKKTVPLYAAFCI